MLSNYFLSIAREKLLSREELWDELSIKKCLKNVPEEKRSPVLVFSGKDLTEVQEELLKERVIGLVKKDDVSMENLSKMIQGIVTK